VGTLRMIPKLCHFIWLGSPPPAWATANMETFRQFHPDWEVKLWEDVPDRFPTALRCRCDENPIFSKKSNIIRYWLLSTYGGVYVDSDVITFRSFNPLLKYTAFTYAWHQTKNACYNGVLGGQQGCAAFRFLVDVYMKREEQLSKHHTGRGARLVHYCCSHGMMELLPAHYFNVLPEPEDCRKFWKASLTERKILLDSTKSKWVDGVPPFGLHLFKTFREVGAPRASE